MTTPLDRKSTLDEIRARFDADVERFANLETGQSATMDAPLAMELITAAAIAATQHARRVLDVGCGAGNNTLKLREQLGRDFDADLLDLSGPMLARAQQRVAAATAGSVRTICEDFRTAELADGAYDIVLAAAVLHHLRDDADWHAAFAKLHRIVAPGGSVWITDLVSHESPAVQQLMWSRYGDYLVQLEGEAYRDKVFAYVDREDSPRPVTYQLDLLRQVGFAQVELLHKRSTFAAFGAIKQK
jgi:tRNA (cmo5U34)-methyltransferase